MSVPRFADVAELADAQVSEACDGDIVEVQVLSSAPIFLQYSARVPNLGSRFYWFSHHATENPKNLSRNSKAWCIAYKRFSPKGEHYDRRPSCFDGF